MALGLRTGVFGDYISGTGWETTVNACPLYRIRVEMKKSETYGGKTGNRRMIDVAAGEKRSGCKAS